MDLIKRIFNKVNEERLTTLAASLAYYFTLATFPAIVGLVALLPYLPIDNLDQIITQMLSNNLPDQVAELILNFTKQTLSVKRPGLLSTTFLGFLWASSKGMTAAVEQINFTYGDEKERGIIKQKLISLFLTILYGITLIVSSLLIVMGQSISTKITLWIGSYDSLEFLLSGFKYILIYSLLIFSFSLIYYFAPTKNQKIKYITPGSLTGASLLIISTIGFNYYIENINNYNAAYGSLGGIAIYMLWLYIISFVLLLGATINSTTEKYLKSV